MEEEALLLEITIKRLSKSRVMKTMTYFSLDQCTEQREISPDLLNFFRLIDIITHLIQLSFVIE